MAGCSGAEDFSETFGHVDVVKKAWIHRNTESFRRVA